MEISPKCVECLYRKQVGRAERLTPEAGKAYLEKVRHLLNTRDRRDNSPFLVSRFNDLYKELGGTMESFGEIKKTYNQLVLDVEEEIRARIAQSKDPMKTAFFLARTGNYIDFSAVKNVSPEELFQMLQETKLSENDEKVYADFEEACLRTHSFLLLADNCGEIVLDKLFLEQLRMRNPAADIVVMVRGGEAMNDATVEDAEQIGLSKVARVVSSGSNITGTMYDLLSEEAQFLMDTSEVILAKGQGNYESLSGQGFHVFYTFLCKCDLFVERFEVPQFTGMLIEEK